MKKIFLFFVLISFSCHQKIDSRSIAMLNGYWEIEKAVLENGKTIDYKINETIDFISLKNKNGFRQKVNPQLDGKYLTNDLKENIKIIQNDENIFLEYSTGFTSWKEEIIELTSDKLVLKNQENTTYYYKKHIPFTLK